MSSEAAFLAAIRAAPTDDTLRLIYADWLEEHGDPRGEYIRLRIQSGRLPRPGRRPGKILTRLGELAEALDPDWIARVFAVPKLLIKRFRSSKRPVTEPVTKFGGQPTWLTKPQWPISRGWDGRPMQFICQIALPEIFKKILAELAAVPFPEVVNLKAKTVFDESSDIYMVIVEGWRDGKRMHGCLAHVEINGGKIWVQQDGTVAIPNAFWYTGARR